VSLLDDQVGLAAGLLLHLVGRALGRDEGRAEQSLEFAVLRDLGLDLVEAVREVGARVFLITDGDVAGAIAAAAPRTGVDLLIGVGGTPEGVVAAAALKCMGGAIHGRLAPRSDEEREQLEAAGLDPDRILTTEDLVSGKDVFFAATGITDGSLLRGVRYWPDGATTYSLVMRSRSGTVRWVEAEHRFEKLEGISGVDYSR
jgi:fructose-1,6-bisphosphatase II